MKRKSPYPLARPGVRSVGSLAGQFDNKEVNQERIKKLLAKRQEVNTIKRVAQDIWDELLPPTGKKLLAPLVRLGNKEVNQERTKKKLKHTKGNKDANN